MCANQQILTNDTGKKTFISFVVFVSFACIGIFESRAQDIHFAQLTEVPQLINPALTGLYDGYYRGMINYRNQWPAMGKSYNTFLGSFDMPLKMKKKQGAYIGLGAYVYSDKAGDSRFGTTQGNLSVSAILPTGMTSKFSMGLQTGFAQRSMTLANIQWPNQYNGFNYDPSMSSNEQAGKTSFSYLDIGAGINYDTYHQTEKIDGKNTNRFDIGASFFHATMPLMKYEPMTKEDLYWKGILHTTIRHDIPGTKFGIVPSMVVMVQWPAYEIFLGTLLRYKINEGTKMTGFSNESAFSGGIYYRYKDAISPQVFLELGDYAFGLSYDFNVSTYRQVAKSAGAFELSIRYSSMRGALMKNKR